MTSSPSLSKTAKLACRAEVEAAGFSYHKGSFVMEIAKDFVGSVGLATAAYPAERKYLITPVVGATNLEVEKLVAGWWRVRQETQRSRYYLPTALTPLGYLMPENTYKSWYFSPDKEAASLAKDMVFCVEVYGLSWMRSLADPRALLHWLLEKQAGSPDFRKYAIPAVYCLLGETQNARDYVRQVVQEIENRGPDYLWSGYVYGWAEEYKRVMLTI